jgi:hypothetical protein
MVLLLLPLDAFMLWFNSLRYVDVGHMNDLGLVSVLPPTMIIALIILSISFCLSLRQPQGWVLIITLHLFLLIFMLYGVTTLVEEAPRFSTVYQHAGYTEYIMRYGAVDPTLDTYFNWPGFFILSAFVTRVAGYQSALSFASWSPVFFNLIYLGPLYMIFTTATVDKRQVWLGLWFFALTNWVAQDTFLPQSFGYFLYLVILAILLRWFKVTPKLQPGGQGSLWQHLSRVSPKTEKFHQWLTAPDDRIIASQPRQRVALLFILVACFAVIVFSHPLTPFFVIVTVTALVIFNRCRPRWLPILMAIMTGAWIILMTRAFLVGHVSMVTGDIGHIGSAVSANVTNRVGQGSPEHNFIVRMRIIMTIVVWGLAVAGGVLRLYRGHRDITYILLAAAPFPLFFVQQYGGEMLLRIYFFTLPAMVFFASALFFPALASKTPFPMIAAIAGISILLLSGFLFTRYGNERVDYMTAAEVDGVHQLYRIAQPGSLLLQGWDGTPWRYQEYEKYDYQSMSDSLSNAVVTQNVDIIIRFIHEENRPDAYLIFTRSQKAWAETLSGLPVGSLDRLETALLTSKRFKLIYKNSDAQIFEYLH